MPLLGEIRRRKVFQVAAVYAVVAWLIIQVVGSVSEPLSLPDWLDTVVIVLLAVGFPVAVIFAWVFELTPAGLVRDAGVAARGPAPRTSKRLGIEAVLVVLLIIAVGWIGYRELGSSKETASQESSQSVAVLPFENLSTDPQNAFFADGIHEEVLNQLAKLSNLRVISRTSMLRFENSDLSIPEIAEQLNVRTVLEGSVRYANERVRISAQLIDAGTDEHLWSDVYERDMSDIFAVQADIAMNIANALATEFSPEEQASIEAIPTESIEAYELYLASLAELRRAVTTNGAMERSLELVEGALALDAEFAEAWAFKARILLGSLLRTPESDVTAVRGSAEAAARRAIELDPELGAAHDALGSALNAGGDWVGAAAEFQRAVALGVGSASYGQFLLAVGKAEEAGPYVERARSLDPLDSSALIFQAGQLLITGNAGASRAELDRGFELFGDWPGGIVQLNMLDLSEGRFDTFNRIANQDNPLSAPEDRDAILAIFRERLQSDGNFAVLGILGAASAELGDLDLALELEDRAIRAVPTGTWDLWKPVFAEMRTQPGFLDLVRRHGLVDYWRASGWPDFCRPLGGEAFECF